MSINRQSVTIMSATGETMSQYSSVVKGDSYYGYTDGLHTIQVIYNQFVGRLRIQATLSLDPTEVDWFDIVPDITTGQRFNDAGYIQYNSNAPADHSEAYTFRGNYTFIRCYMDRDHIGDFSTYDPSYGQVSRIILSS